MLIPRCSPMSTSPRGRQRPHSKQISRAVVQPGEDQKPKEPEVFGKSNTESPSEQKLDLQAEPTVTFLFTLLNTPEPRDSESDVETLEKQFLDQDDWGLQRTTKEMRHLRNECQRLLEALSITQADNLALGEKLRNLPTLLYMNLKEETQATQEEAQSTEEEALSEQEAMLLQMLQQEGLLPCLLKLRKSLLAATQLPEGSAASPDT